MDTRFLASLVAVVETGSIAGAARQQNLTPAAIGQRIRALEDELKVTLLSRAGHSAKPTADCLRIIPRLKKIIAESDALQFDLSDDIAGKLRIGTIATALTSYFPTLLQHLSQQYPNLLPQIVPGSAPQLFEQLTQGNLDMTVTVCPPFKYPKFIRELSLYQEPLVLLYHPALHAEATSQNLQVTLAQLPYIEYDKQAWGGKIAAEYLKKYHLKPQKVCAIDALDSIALMVKMGMGVSLVPYWQGLKDNFPELATIAINDPHYTRHIACFSHRQSGKEGLITAVEKALQECVPV